MRGEAGGKEVNTLTNQSSQKLEVTRGLLIAIAVLMPMIPIFIIVLVHGKYWQANTSKIIHVSSAQIDPRSRTLSIAGGKWA